MFATVNGARLFFDVEGAGTVPDGPSMRDKPTIIILETSVECEKDVQDIGVYRKIEKHVFTFPVMSVFSSLLGGSRACADFRESTEVSRIMAHGGPGADHSVYKPFFSQLSDIAQLV